MKSFFIGYWRDLCVYVGRIRQFKSSDWCVYVAWLGLMLGLFFAVTGFLLVGVAYQVPFPDFVWNIPLGIFIFLVAISIDTIGHLTVYKEFLKKGEQLVHHITIVCGISSVVGLCLGYSHPDFFYYPTLVLIALSLLYSVIDEALHWQRYFALRSDRVEMWSHFFIFVGHTLMILSWWHWFSSGYPGVQEVLHVLGHGPLP